MNEQKTVRVTGRGMIRLKPDTMCVTMTLEGLDPDYTETLKHSADDTDRIRNAIASVGFSREDLKTLDFHVHPEYEGYREDDVYRQRLIGYRFRHELKLEFAFDNERLGRVLAALCGTALTPEINIGYTVKDREAAKNALIGAAVKDAQQKAAALAEAAGVQLRGIRRIDYSMDEIALAVRPMLFAGAKREMCEDSVGPEIVPEDIKAEDTVTIEWELE